MQPSMDRGCTTSEASRSASRLDANQEHDQGSIKEFEPDPKTLDHFLDSRRPQHIHVFTTKRNDIA